MKILLIGVLGQLGTDLRKTLCSHELVCVDKEELDVCEAAQVERAVDAHKPDLILNCSAFHRVDDCEDMVETTFAVNVYGVRNLALAARRTDSVLMHFSTDYVFGGPERCPHPETDMPSPRCIYAVSKLSGEFMLRSLWPKHFIVRSCGLYGYAGSREKGTNFVETMIRLGKGDKPLRVVDDQICTPTSTATLARAVEQLIGTREYGLYHLTNAGQCSWYEFACRIFKLAGLNPQVSAVSSGQFPTRATRPDYSVLDNRHFRDVGFQDMPHWTEALEEYVCGRAAAGRV